MDLVTGPFLGRIASLSKHKLLGKDSVDSLQFCEHCILGKAKRLEFATIVHHSKGTLECIYSDVWGPTRVPSHNRARFFLSIVDGFSKKVWIYRLKQNSEAFEKFKEWKVLIKT